MFFDDRLRGPQLMDSSTHQDLIVENLSENIYNSSIPNDDFWRKCALPTPPYSPENYLAQAGSKRNFNIPSRRNGLQVVPEPEDLSSDLPGLVFSDAEMERLTCSTMDDEYIWPAGESDLDRVESQRFQGNRVVLAAPCAKEREAIAEMAAEHRMLNDLSPFITSVTSQDPTLAQQQVDARWQPHFSGEYCINFVQKIVNFIIWQVCCFVLSLPFHFRIVNNDAARFDILSTCYGLYRMWVYTGIITLNHFHS